MFTEYQIKFSKPSEMALKTLRIMEGKCKRPLLDELLAPGSVFLEEPKGAPSSPIIQSVNQKLIVMVENQKFEPVDNQVEAIFLFCCAHQILGLQFCKENSKKKSLLKFVNKFF